MEGRVRAIGVCNFYPDRLTDLAIHAEVIPAVNQVELHPFFQQEKAIRNMKELGIQPGDRLQKESMESSLILYLQQSGRSMARALLR